MSKRAAEKWSQEQQQKKNLPNINYFVTGKCYIVTEKEHNMKLLQFVTKKFGLDPPSARLKILNGEVWIKDSLHAQYADLKPNGVVSCGDKVCATRKRERKPMPKPGIKITDRVIYKDERIIIIDKWWDIAVHGGSGHAEDNIEELLPQLVEEGEELPRLVHRLDKGTTGILILARNAKVASQLAEYFKTGEKITKRYVALVAPTLKEKLEEFEPMTITTGLVRYGDNRSERMKCVEWKDSYVGSGFNDIKKAVTKVTVLKHRRLLSLVCFEPLTGRKHQIRAHVEYAFRSSFILGDYKYGVGCTKKYAHQVSDPLKVHMHLHLTYLKIVDWFGEGKDLTVCCPIPMFFSKSMTCSGFEPSMIQLCKEPELKKPVKKEEPPHPVLLKLWKSRKEFFQDPLLDDDGDDTVKDTNSPIDGIKSQREKDVPVDGEDTLKANGNQEKL